MAALPNCRPVGIPHTAQPKGEDHAPNSHQKHGEDASLGTKTAATKQGVTVEADSKQMAAGPLTTVRYAVEVKLTPSSTYCPISELFLTLFRNFPNCAIPDCAAI